MVLLVFAKQVPQPVTWKHAQRYVGYRFNAVHGSVGKLLLQADKITRQQKIEYLPAAIAQAFVAKRPTRIQGKKFTVWTVLVNQCAARINQQCSAAKVFNTFQLSSGERRECTRLAQAAGGAVRLADFGRQDGYECLWQTTHSHF